MAINELYEELTKKHSLPKFEELDYEFDIASIEDKKVLRAIRRKMSEKLEQYAKLMEDLIQPDGTFSSLYEVKDFTEDDKNNLLSLFKKMMVFYKESIKLNLNFSEEEDVNFIKRLLAFWKEIKPQLALIIDKLSENWKNDSTHKIIQDYLG